VWPNERAYRLLALLAHRAAWVGRTELAALFWPDLPAARALANVRKVLHLARGLPWCASIEVQRDAVRWAVATDVQAFELATRQGRGADALAIAASGELLDGMDDAACGPWTEWIDNERALHRRRVHALTRALLAEVAQRPGEAVELARRLLGKDPLDEDAVVVLLGALRALGREAERRVAYRDYALRLDEELGVEPSQRVRSLAADDRDEAPAGSAREPGPVASPSAGALLGRDRELAALCELIERPGSRLVTLTGPGGIGKSTLAKFALRRVAPRFAGGGHWIALDDLLDADQVCARIAAELGVRPEPSRPLLTQLLEHAASREILLCLDNAEHLADLPRLVDRLLEHAPGLRICATSRVRLGLRGESLLPLAGLALPRPTAVGEEVLACAAAQLFVAAAREVRPDFDRDREAGAIGALARATGGLPLAILLAANWVRLLPVAEIVAELHRSLDLLASGDEGEERPEHGSVRATFSQSWARLAVREQKALGALAIFAGGFGLEAAREVANASLPILASLTDKSLVEAAGRGRFVLHPLIRQYAREMVDAETLGAACARHARYFQRRLAQLESAAQAADQAALDEIDIDLENFRQAWRAAVANRSGEALAGGAVALKEYFNVRGRVAEGLELLAEARPLVDDGVDPGHGAVILAAIAQTHYRLSQLDAAATEARRGIRLARRARGTKALVRCLGVLGTCYWQWGRHQEASRVLAQAARQAGSAGDSRGAALALHNLALVEKALGHHAKAAALMEEWLVSQREQSEWLRVAMGLSNLAYVYQAIGEWERAQACLEEGLVLCEAHDLALPRLALLANLAHNHASMGRLDEAESACGRVIDEAQRKALGDVEATARNQLVRIELARGNITRVRERLRAATVLALRLGIEYVQLDCVLSFARLLAREARDREAAPLLRQLLARTDLEPVDRAQAESCLRDLSAEARDSVPSQASLETLLRAIERETAAPRQEAHSRAGGPA
jgi:predicted ATPase